MPHLGTVDRNIVCVRCKLPGPSLTGDRWSHNLYHLLTPSTAPHTRFANPAFEIQKAINSVEYSAHFLNPPTFPYYSRCNRYIY